MPTIRDQGIELIRKSVEPLTPGSKTEYLVRVKVFGGVVSTEPVEVTPTIVNLSAPVANQVYSFLLPASCKGFYVKARKISKVTLSYSSGGPYITIGRGGHWDEFKTLDGVTVYLTSDIANNDFEIITYT